MRFIDSASVSILHSAASVPWWGWLIVGWLALDVVIVGLRYLATREREDRSQIVSDAFDVRAYGEAAYERARRIAQYEAAKARKDTRAQNSAYGRARAATIVELRTTMRGGR